MKPGAWSAIASLGSAIRRGDHSLDVVPDLIKEVLSEELWRDFVTPRGEVVHHDRFEDFVTTAPTPGLGASTDLVRRIIADDIEAVDLFDQAVQRPAHRHADVNNINVRPMGTSTGQALRRLRKDAPDLHAEVLADHLSAHAAMVQAGFRPKTITIRVDSPDRIAATLRRHLSDESRAELRRLLDD